MRSLCAPSRWSSAGIQTQRRAALLSVLFGCLACVSKCYQHPLPHSLSLSAEDFKLRSKPSTTTNITNTKNGYAGGNHKEHKSEGAMSKRAQRKAHKATQEETTKNTKKGTQRRLERFCSGLLRRSPGPSPKRTRPGSRVNLGLPRGEPGADKNVKRPEVN